MNLISTKFRSEMDIAHYNACIFVSNMAYTGCPATVSHTLIQYLNPSKGEFFKSAKRESYFFCLKKIPSDFRGGVIIENLEPHQFWKKSQKREFSLGNIGESPKMKNVATVLHILIQYLNPSKGEFFKSAKGESYFFCP